MAVTIKLIRIGKKSVPHYRIVVMDKRKKRNGAYIEKIGTYEPLVEPAKLTIDHAKLESWLLKGAQLSEGIHKLLKNRLRKKASTD